MSLQSDYDAIVNTGAFDIPNQMCSTKKKMTSEWKEGSMDYLVSSIYSNVNTKRKTYDEMQENINLVNSVPDIEDIRKSFDPLNLDENENTDNLPLKEEFYNIINPPLNTIFGEELKRRSDIRGVVVNQSAINKKDEEFNDKLFNFFMGQAQQESVDENDLQEKLQGFDKYRKYDLQSAHEKMVNQIIQMLTSDRRLDTKQRFNDGFKSLNTVAEEILRVGRKGNEPWLYNVNSKNFTVLGLGDSNYVHDGWAWIEYEFLSPNKILEEFNRELSNVEIQRLLERDNSFYADHITPLTAAYIQEGGDVLVGDDRGALASNGAMLSIDGEYTTDNKWVDEHGNIRVVRCQWLSLRKIGELKYYDEYGDEQKMFVDEYFKADKALGQEIDWFWVNELWEGTKIGTDIYVGVKPSEIQMRSMINPAIVRPHYIGVIDSFMTGKARCIVDEIKPYQYKFNVTMIKLNQLLLQHIGKAAIIDVSRIPSHMDTTEWFRWLRIFGIAFENPFEESNKGLISGHMQQNSRNIDLSHAEEINMQIQLLSFYENMINKIAAIPEQRQGNLQGNEGLGVSQEAIMRSSTQTEGKFQLHEYVKASTFEVLIEYVKVLWKDEKGKRQYQLDDVSNYILDLDGDVLNEAEYGIQITNSTRVYEVENTLNQLAHAGMQTGTITMSDYAKMRMSTSPSEMLKTLEQAEEKRLQQQQEAQKMQMEAQQQQLAAQQELEQIKHKQELEKLDKEYQYKIQIEQMKLQDKADADVFNQYANDDNKNGVEDWVEIDKEEIKADIKEKEIKSKEKMFYDELKQDRELELAKLKTQKEIAGQNAIKSRQSNSK